MNKDYISPEKKSQNNYFNSPKSEKSNNSYLNNKINNLEKQNYKLKTITFNLKEELKSFDNISLPENNLIIIFLTKLEIYRIKTNTRYNKGKTHFNKISYKKIDYDNNNLKETYKNNKIKIENYYKKNKIIENKIYELKENNIKIKEKLFEYKNKSNINNIKNEETMIQIKNDINNKQFEINEFNIKNELINKKIDNIKNDKIKDKQKLNDIIKTEENNIYANHKKFIKLKNENLNQKLNIFLLKLENTRLYNNNNYDNNNRNNLIIKLQNIREYNIELDNKFNLLKIKYQNLYYNLKSRNISKENIHPGNDFKIKDLENKEKRLFEENYKLKEFLDSNLSY